MADSIQKTAIGLMLARLQAISVANGYRTELGAGITRGRLQTDAISNTSNLPVGRLARASESREYDAHDRVRVTLTLHLEIAVAANSTQGDALEDAYADVLEAVEDKDDLYLASAGKNLLGDIPPRVVDAPLNVAEFGSSIEIVALGIELVFPQLYGDPTYVI